MKTIESTKEPAEQASPSGLSRREAVLGIASGSAVLAFGGAFLGCAQPTADLSSEAGEATLVFDLGASAPGASEVFPFPLPPLSFPVDAVAAVVDARTMEIHHGKHHQGYTNKLNAAVEGQPELKDKTLFQLLGSLSDVPSEVRTAIGNNGGGYLNHALFWPLLAPGGAAHPDGDLAEAIQQSFGSVEDFRKEFSGKAKSVFGSGWAWLTADAAGGLRVDQYANQETPLGLGLKPVLGIDVWEHAYYLKYQNRRADYVDNFLDTVNWTQAGTNFAA